MQEAAYENGKRFINTLQTNSSISENLNLISKKASLGSVVAHVSNKSFLSRALHIYIFNKELDAIEFIEKQNFELYCTVTRLFIFF